MPKVTYVYYFMPKYLLKILSVAIHNIILYCGTKVIVREKLSGRSLIIIHPLIHIYVLGFERKYIA